MKSVKRITDDTIKTNNFNHLKKRQGFVGQSPKQSERWCSCEYSPTSRC